MSAYAHITWTATALGGSYHSTRIYRDGHLVKELFVEATDEWDDYEAPLGVEASYQIRVVHTNGTFSLLSAADTVTLPASTGFLPERANLWSLTSNIRPDLNLDVLVVGGIDYEFNSNVLELALHSRDNVAVFRELEDRGDAFVLHVQVRVAIDGDVDDEDRAMFDALQTLERAGLPYVCVRSPYGDTWYASIRIPQGNVRLRYLGSVDLHVREVTSVPVAA